MQRPRGTSAEGAEKRGLPEVVAYRAHSRLKRRRGWSRGGRLGKYWTHLGVFGFLLGQLIVWLSCSNACEGLVRRKDGFFQIGQCAVECLEKAGQVIFFARRQIQRLDEIGLLSL